MNTVTKLVTSLALLSTMSMAQTLVTVNGTSITQEDVYQKLMQATQGRFNQFPPEKQAKFGQDVLQELVAMELIYGNAKKTGLLNSKDFKERYDEIAKKIKKEIAVQVWEQREQDKIAISNDEMKKYYNNNKEEFKDKSANARHILVKTEDEAKTLAKQLKGLSGTALVNKFSELAKAKSTGPSGIDGGKLPTFSPRNMVAEFSKVAFSMKVGTVSEPVQTQFGFHLIYLEDRNVRPVEFDEAKEIISKRLKREKAKTVMFTKMQELKNKATIKIHEMKDLDKKATIK